MHLVIYFCGTGNLGQSFKDSYDYVNNQKIKTLFVEGCHHPEVCNGRVFPNLHQFAKRFVKKVFVRNEGKLKLSSGSLTDLKIGTTFIPYEDKQVEKITLSDDELKENITGITLCGYSRGGGLCFEFLKELFELAPDVPVDIVADQPVPGNSYQGFGTNARSIADCTKLTNLRNVSIILGAYTGAKPDFVGKKETNKTSLFHRIFFSQSVPQFSSKTNLNLIVIPREHHNQYSINVPDGEEHVHMEIAKYLFQCNPNYIEKGGVERKIKEAAETYLNPKHPSPNFPPVKLLQGFFGMEKEDVYMYTDKLHPTRNLRQGYEQNKDEKLIDWWNRHDKHTSFFSTQLTKDLKAKIQEFDDSNNQELNSSKNLTILMEVFAKADKWLMLKEGSRSSRWEEVNALRAIVFYSLATKNVKKHVLYAKNLELLHEANFFQKHWNRLSNAASDFKTDATKRLDVAFDSHAQGKMADQELLNELNAWLEVKSDRVSSRYNIVFRISKRLEQVIENNKVQQTDTNITHSPTP